MIASERSLASAHQTHSQQHRQQPTTLGKARNGATKPPIRPVKIYVIDPRKLQQRLEAYVDQKNQKRAEAEAEKEKARQDGGKQTQETCKTSTTGEKRTVCPSALSIKSSVTANPTTITTKAHTTKPLPALVPRFSATPLAPIVAPPNNVMNNGSNQQESIPIGNALNGVTLQSLPCINGASLGLPALPLVVTNGVALIQPPPPNSQSSIPTSGLFLPGITAIPSILTGTDGTFKTKPYSTAQKRKVKKKKAKKRKTVSAKEKDDDDDRELSYLLKETTTRLGRISRPVSQPHSPSLAVSISATSSRAPSPNSKLKKKIPHRKEVSLRCETCVQVFVNKEKLDSHFGEFPLHKRNSAVISESSQQQLTSTNTNIQGMTQTATSSSPSSPFAHLGAKESVTIGNDRLSKQNTTEETSVTHIHQASFNGTIKNGLTDTFDFTDRMAKMSKMDNLESLADSTQVPFKPSPTCVSHESLTANATIFSGTTIRGRNEHHVGSFATCLDNDKGAAMSLVPTTEEHTGLFSRSMSPNVVQVPSSYSLPSSPPSRCLSPGLPDGLFSGASILNRGVSSPIATCNSPIDPMLLRSRSPFPVPPNPETSSHSVCASNLSIPEESLCKGELFMDLGDGCLENPRSISAVSPTPFSDNDMAIFADSNHSLMKEQTQEAVPQDDGILDSDHVEIEQRDSNSAAGPLVVSVTPMLLETTTEDANDGEIFQTARAFLHPSVLSSTNIISTNLSATNEERIVRTYPNCTSDLPRTPQSVYMESDVSMDSSEIVESSIANNQRCSSIWQFVKDQIKSHGISQACGEISEMADKLSRIARDHFIPIREEEIERLGNSSSIIHVDTPFFSHLLDLPFGMYIFKEDIGTRKRVPPPPPMTSSELSFTGGVEDVEKFLPPDIDLISLPHLTNLDLT